MKELEKIKILLADDERQHTRRLAEFLNANGFEARTAHHGKEARSLILDWKPRLVIADLMLTDGNALSLIDFIKNEPTLRHQVMHVLVASSHNIATNVREAISRGARDYIVKPILPEDLLKRVVFHCRSYRGLHEIASKESTGADDASRMLHQTDLVLRQAMTGGTIQDILFNLTRMVCLKVEGVRCSIIHCADQKFGHVVTSHDDRNATGIQLDLYKYPEVLHVLNTQNLVAIENLDENLELRHVRDNVKEISFNSMIVTPISRWGKPFGVLSLRMPPEKQRVSDNEIRFVEIVGHVISLVLSNQLHKETGDFWNKGDGGTTIAFPLRAVKNQ